MELGYDSTSKCNLTHPITFVRFRFPEWFFGWQQNRRKKCIHVLATIRRMCIRLRPTQWRDQKLTKNQFFGFRGPFQLYAHISIAANAIFTPFSSFSIFFSFFIWICIHVIGENAFEYTPRTCVSVDVYRQAFSSALRTFINAHEQLLFDHSFRVSVFASPLCLHSFSSLFIENIGAHFLTSVIYDEQKMGIPLLLSLSRSSTHTHTLIFQTY